VCALAILVSAALFLSVRSVSHAAPDASTPAVAQISIRNVQFSPATLEVTAGTVVEWKNDDLIPHTATSVAFDSGSLATGKSWRRTFTEAGTFNYVCSFHPTMKGVVVVK
jgi:plastocyanin